MINKFIAVNDTSHNIAQKLTQKTCEIEDTKMREIPQEIVIGKVVNVEKHPNADKLVKCEVNCWNTTKIICTGATNVKKNSFVPVALPWCYLPVIAITIKEVKMRWEKSEWMICAKSELGINIDSDQKWIRNLDEDFQSLDDNHIGNSVIATFPRLDNTMRDVDNKTLTNRPDLTWHFGVANEIYTIYNYEDKKKINFHSLRMLHERYDNNNVLNLLANGHQSNIKVSTQTDDCRSYTLLELDGINVQASDFYLKLQLHDLWLSSVNNRVDLSNYFMYLSGQPIHFFDAEKIIWNITVRYAHNEESFVDLFGTHHLLKDNDLVITDDEKVVALAGIVWSINSAITNNTKHILVEIANFAAVPIRKTAQRIWLRTDASMRYEKNINPQYSLKVFELFLDTCQQFSNSFHHTYIWSSHTYTNATYTSMISPQSISFSPTKCNLLFFANESVISYETMRSILQDLWFLIQNQDTDLIDYVPPSWRWPDDITISEDIIEEVWRIYWYENCINDELIIPQTISKMSFFEKLYAVFIIRTCAKKSQIFWDIKNFWYLKRTIIDCRKWYTRRSKNVSNNV